MGSTLKVIAYARVSSHEQAVDSHALNQQIERLKLAGAEEIYVDIESGYKGAKRPQLEKLMEKVRSRQVSQVIVTRIDRLSRKGRQAFSLFDDFLEAGVILKALDEPFDLSTPAGKMAAGQLAVFAQYHSDQKSEAVKHGWQHLRNRKVAMNPPFGYRKIDNKHCLDHEPFLCLLFNRETRTKAAIASEIVAAFFEAGTLRGCLKIINERYGIQTFAHHNKSGGLFARGIFRFSPAGLKNWLTSPVLQGHLCYLKKQNGKVLNPQDWKIIYNTHPDQAIINATQAQEIEKMLTRNRQVRGYGCIAQKYPLSGLVFCGECRSSCYSLKGSRGRNQPGYNYYFQCKNWRVRSCNQKTTIRMEAIEKAVIHELTAAATRIADLASEPTLEIEPLEIRELRQQLAGLNALGSNPAIEKAKKDIENQIQGLKLKARSLSEKSETNKDLLIWAFSDPECWEKLDVQKKTQVFKSLVDRIVVKDGQVQSITLTV